MFSHRYRARKTQLHFLGRDARNEASEQSSAARSIAMPGCGRQFCFIIPRHKRIERELEISGEKAEAKRMRSWRRWRARYTRARIYPSAIAHRTNRKRGAARGGGKKSLRHKLPRFKSYYSRAGIRKRATLERETGKQSESEILWVGKRREFFFLFHCCRKITHVLMLKLFTSIITLLESFLSSLYFSSHLFLNAQSSLTFARFTFCAISFFLLGGFTFFCFLITILLDFFIFCWEIIKNSITGEK